MKGAVITLALTSVGLSACATVARAPFDWRDGWREGLVEQITAYASLRTRPGTDCVEETNGNPNQTVAVVRYQHHGQLRHQIVAVQKAGAFQTGERVYINMLDCQAPLQKRAGEQ